MGVPEFARKPAWMMEQDKVVMQPLGAVRVS